MIPNRTRPLLLLPLALLAACSILPDREPTTIYSPAHRAVAVDAAVAPASWSLVIDKPMADEWLNSDTIAVRPDPGAVQVYKGASWSDQAPNLVQTALLRAFEDSQKILSVSRTGSVVHGDFELLTELRAFEAVYTAPGRPEAKVEIYAKLVDTTDGSVVAARLFSESAPASGVEVQAVVDAFSQALDRSSAQVAGWTLAEGNRKAATRK
jgi:cholesterol transport system auxiliary component